MNFSRLLPNYQRVYTDSTMKGWTKDQLIKHIRMCENNIAALAERVENQAELLKMYLPDNCEGAKIDTPVYNVTITDCDTLIVTRKQVHDPLEALSVIKWAELHAQHQVEQQIDIRVTTKSGDIIHIKAREMT